MKNLKNKKYAKFFPPFYILNFQLILYEEGMGDDDKRGRANNVYCPDVNLT
jgi:hypothetical protein